MFVCVCLVFAAGDDGDLDVDYRTVLLRYISLKVSQVYYPVPHRPKKRPCRLTVTLALAMTMIRLVDVSISQPQMLKTILRGGQTSRGSPQAVKQEVLRASPVNSISVGD